MRSSSRFISFFLVISLSIGFFVVPASAAEVDNDNLLNVLDYATMNETGTNSLVFKGLGTFSYTLPQGMYVGYIDMVICTGSVVLTDILYHRSATAAGESLKIMPIDSAGRYVRIYGAVSSYRVTTIYFDVVASSSSSNCVLDIVSLRVGRIGFTSQEDKVQVSLYSNTSTWSPGNDELFFPTDGTSYNIFNASLYPLNWERYDYFDFYLTFLCGEISSVYAVCDGTYLPISYTYIGDEMSGSGDYTMLIRIDLTGLDRTGEDPKVYITGVGSYTGTQLYFYSGVGYVETETVSFWSYWMQKIYAALAGDTESTVGSDLIDQGAQIEDFESQHQLTLEEGISGLQQGADISGFAPALVFISNYLTSVYSSLGDYQIVYTLPLTIGMILFLASRVRGSDKPKKHNSSPPKHSGGTTSGSSDESSYSSYY